MNGSSEQCNLAVRQFDDFKPKTIFLVTGLLWVLLLIGLNYGRNNIQQDRHETKRENGELPAEENLEYIYVCLFSPSFTMTM